MFVNHIIASYEKLLENGLNRDIAKNILNDFVYFRKIKYFTAFVYFIHWKCPNWKYFTYDGPQSETYKNITRWCDIYTDLQVASKDGNKVLLKKTYNDLLYDPRKDAFLTLRYDFEEQHRLYINTSAFLTYPRDIQSDGWNNSYFKEAGFPPDLLEELEKREIISKRYKIHTMLLEDFDI